MVVWALQGLPAGAAQAPLPPHLPRVGANLVPNATFPDTATWVLGGGASYEAGVSRSADGSGAIRLPPGGRVDTAGAIAVTPGKTYTFAASIRTAAWPPGNVDMAFSVATASGDFVRYGGESGAAGNSGPNRWEEIVLTITPDATTTFVTLIIGRIYPDSGVSEMWVDEWYFGEGIGFEQPPAPKVPFAGADVQVDALGNVSVKKGGQFQPFFPLCIYADGRRPDWAEYSNQGFNCDMWGNSGSIQRAKDAVSALNPDGMMTGIQVVQYMNPGGWGWDPGGVNLTNEIKACKATGLFDSHVLLYYWDNENVWTEFPNQMQMAGILKSVESTAGQRTHPVYVLQGSYNAARMYQDASTGAPGADITGTYIDAANTGGAGHAGGQEILQNIQGQTQPVTFQQMNIVVPGIGAGALRRYLYQHVARGARGIGIWRDLYVPEAGAPAMPVHLVEWWPDVPNLRRELDHLLPLIRQPHWTTWRVAYDAALPLTVGTRDYQGQGYLLVSNTSDAAVTVTFTLTGLPYTPQRVVDYFTGQAVTTVAGNAFTVTLPALGLNSGTAVYQIVGSATPVPRFPSPTGLRMWIP